ncbi:MAG: DUF998 domain-containing protein [Methanomassiliicoccales archaeon]|jgi:hypothetical membrane protein|nr:DUF998 domain-containing protein [Methanomassiliicoccales archaeon]
MPNQQKIIRIGASCGLTGAIIFAIMWIIAAMVDTNWVLGEQTLSELGGDRPGRIFFNNGVIIEALLSIVFVFGLSKALRNDSLGKAGSAVFFLAAISLLGVGIFPITTGIYHTVASYSFFGLSLIALIILIRPLRSSKVFGAIFSIMTVVAIIISLGFLFFTNIPTAEAVAVICLLFWSSVISARMLTAKGV